MTFFFRFLRPVIENGYLYIAQPPLYRYKRGRSEMYLKDDKALKEFLIDRGIDSINIKGIDREDLKSLFKLVGYYQIALNELDKRFSLIRDNKIFD